MSSKIIDTEELVQQVITAIMARPQSLIFLDLEGVDLSRNGSISIIQVLLPPDPMVYLVDVHILGDKTFNTPVGEDTLRSVLESKDFAKVFYDVRNDSDALFHHFGVNLRSVIDIQVIEFVSRPHRGRFVKGLAKCVDDEKSSLSDIFDQWKKTKDRGRGLFVPELGGSYDILLERPIRTDIIEYCLSDVLIMPRLLAIYSKRLDAGVGSQVQRLTDERIRLSQSASFNGKGRHMAVGPNLTRTNSDVKATTFPMTLISSSGLESLCRVPVSPVDTEKAYKPGTSSLLHEGINPSSSRANHKKRNEASASRGESMSHMNESIACLLLSDDEMDEMYQMWETNDHDEEMDEMHRMWEMDNHDYEMDEMYHIYEVDHVLDEFADDFLY